MALQGDLSEFQLTDIVQLVDLSKKTGAVFLQGRRGPEQMEGWLYFRDGKIIGAKLGSMAPLDAVYTFFTFSSGPFQFHEDVQLEIPTITQSNEMIIMEGIMRQDAWEKLQAQLPPLTMIPRLVTNPSATGSEINIEADEWRVLTMVNGKNTVAQISQRSGLGELRTCEIIARLLNNGLIEKRDTNLSEILFPEMERIVTTALGASARGLLEDAYVRAGIQQHATATSEQIDRSIGVFEGSANRVFGPGRVRQAVAELRAHMHHVFDSLS